MIWQVQLLLTHLLLSTTPKHPRDVWTGRTVGPCRLSCAKRPEDREGLATSHRAAYPYLQLHRLRALSRDLGMYPDTPSGRVPDLARTSLVVLVCPSDLEVGLRSAP